MVRDQWREFSQDTRMTTEIQDLNVSFKASNNTVIIMSEKAMS